MSNNKLKYQFINGDFNKANLIMLDFRYDKYISDQQDSLLRGLSNSSHNILFTEFSKMLHNPLSPHELKILSDSFIECLVSLIPSTEGKTVTQVHNAFSENIDDLDEAFLEECFIEFTRLMNLPNLKEHFNDSIFTDLDSLITPEFKEKVVEKYQQIISNCHDNQEPQGLDLGRYLKHRSIFEVSHYFDDKNSMPFYKKFYWSLSVNDNQPYLFKESYPQNLYEYVHSSNNPNEKINEALKRMDDFNICNVNVFVDYDQTVSFFQPKKLVNQLIDQPELVSLAEKILKRIDNDTENKLKFIVIDSENVTQSVWIPLLKRVYQQNNPEITDLKLLNQKFNDTYVTHFYRFNDLNQGIVQNNLTPVQITNATYNNLLNNLTK